MARLSLSLCLLLLALAAAPFGSGLEVGEGTDVLDLDAQCSSQLDSLWLKYTNSSGVPDCDQPCLTRCYQVLQAAIYSTKNKNCPPQSDIVSCFNVYSDEWEEYVKQCELFTFSDSESEGESSSEAEAESSSEAEAEAETSGGEGESEANSGRRRRLLSEGESEGEGVAGGGCFPEFESAEDFEKYIDGEWEYSTSSNTAGIVLSVAFFVSLVGLALFLKS